MAGCTLLPWQEIMSHNVPAGKLSKLQLESMCQRDRSVRVHGRRDQHWFMSGICSLSELPATTWQQERGGLCQATPLLGA